MIERFQHRFDIFLIKLRSWEYWPFSVVYFPVFFYWAWLTLKARSLFFFFSANPGIENGGWLGESKFKIIDIIQDKWKPKTLFFAKETPPEDILIRIKQNKLDFPFILKPDIGERGWKVEKISTLDEFDHYLKEVNYDFLVQEYVDYPIELGVFYYRLPGNEKGKISSIVVKEFLHVIGDGESTVEELILKSSRARLQVKTLQKRYGVALKNVLPKNHEWQLMPIGNHCRGTKFLNGNRYISDELEAVFDEVGSGIKGFYFGRYDIRCKSIPELYKGNFKILELNGAGSEPGHIYHPGASLLKGYQSIFHHLNILYQISALNNRDGFLYPTFRDGFTAIHKYRTYNKTKLKV